MKQNKKLTLRLPEELIKFLRERASDEDRSVSAIIRRMIDAEKENAKKEKK